jgi:hypothetical protein
MDYQLLKLITAMNCRLLKGLTRCPLLKMGSSNGRLLKVMSVAVHIQRRLQPRLQGSVAIAFSNGSSIVVHPFQHLQVSRC